MGSIMIELKGKLIYKSNILFTMFAALASILVQIALWQYLYRDDAAMMGYMMGYVIYANVIRTIYSNQIYHILAGKILNGDFLAGGLLRYHMGPLRYVHCSFAFRAHFIFSYICHHWFYCFYFC